VLGLPGCTVTEPLIVAPWMPQMYWYVPGTVNNGEV